MTIAKVDAASRWLLSKDGAADARELVVTIPIGTRSENNMREHHMARHRRRQQQRRIVGLVLAAALRLEPVRPPCVVTLTRIAPRKLDGDNLQGALKAVRDQVATCLGIDDGTDEARWEYGQEPAGKQVGVRISIRAVG